MTLFEDKHRTNTRPRWNAEPLYPFMDRSATEGLDAVRNVLEDWLSRFPVEHQRELVSKFRSNRDDQHRAAFFELFLHEYLLRLGCQVVVHPDPETGASKRPDFLVRAPEGTIFFLEAVIATGLSREDAAKKKVLHTVYDLIDSIESPNFWLHLVHVEQGTGPPPTKRLRRNLLKRLTETDPDQLLASGDTTPEWRFQEGDWEWVIGVAPKSVEARGQEGDRPIGVYPPEGGFINPGKGVKAALLEKASRYGVLGQHYIVAVNGLEPFHRELFVMEALFGRECAVVYPGAPGAEPVWTRQPDGLWTTPPVPSHTRISAVLSFIDLAPWNIPQREARLYHNPWASLPLTPDALDVTQGVPCDDRLVWHPGTPLGTLFGLPEDWPLSDVEVHTVPSSRTG